MGGDPNVLRHVGKGAGWWLGALAAHLALFAALWGWRVADGPPAVRSTGQFRAVKIADAAPAPPPPPIPEPAPGGGGNAGGGASDAGASGTGASAGGASGASAAVDQARRTEALAAVRLILANRPVELPPLVGGWAGGAPPEAAANPAVTAGAVGGGGSGSGLGGAGRGGLFGVEIESRPERLVALLDSSGSMEPLLERVRREVEERYPGARILLVKGSLFADDKAIRRLKRRGTSDYFADYYSTLVEESVIPTVARLVAEKEKPDAIYFFGDAKDYVDEIAVNDFQDLLKAKHVKFYVHSVGDNPPETLQKLCKKTGGASWRAPVAP